MIHLDPSHDNVVALIERNIEGPISMLNLLKFRDVADYAIFPALAPAGAISGRAAYELYMTHTLPFLEATGGSISLVGEGGSFFVGPSVERWDLALIVRQTSIEHFFAFASNEEYLTGVGHRTAAVADTRILPLVVR